MNTLKGTVRTPTEQPGAMGTGDWSHFREQRDRIGPSADLQKRVDRLEILLDVCSYLATSLDLNTTLSRISEVSRDMLNAAEASIMVLDEHEGTLNFEVVTGDKGRRLKGMQLKLGEGIAGQVAATGEPRLIPDCSKEPGHARRFDQLSGFITRSILCVPLVSQGQVVGVLEALNKKDEGCFDEDDLEIALGLAQVAGASVMNARLFNRLKQAQAETVLAGKLAALGTIASGIAHELNQPLTGIIGFVQLLERKVAQGPLTTESATQQLSFIEKQAHRMARIINHIRTFAHPSPVAESAPVDLNQVIEDARMLMNEQFASHSIRLSLELDPDLPRVLGDSVRLEEVVINLLANARDAVDKKAAGNGQVRVATRTSDGGVQIEVRDNGTGIPDDVLTRIFDPFFTTKEKGSGNGLGLSLAHGIVRDHGGSIEVESRLGEGTSFFVTLPVRKAA